VIGIGAVMIPGEVSSVGLVVLVGAVGYVCWLESIELSFKQ